MSGRRGEEVSTLTVAALQTALYPKDEKRAIREGASMVRAAAAAKRSARLICFPEHWLIDKVLAPGDETYGIFTDLARELDAYINLGGVFEKENDESAPTYFLSPTISPSGAVISRQKKVHLFRRESTLAIPGDSFGTFKLDEKITIGVMVCHDVVFPESARTLVLKGAELLLNPSLIPAVGIEPWRTYLMARALENRVPIVAPNPYLNPRVPGHSEILGLEYETKQGVMLVKELPRPLSGRRVIVSKLTFNEQIKQLRNERLTERKPGAYIEKA